MNNIELFRSQLLGCIGRLEEISKINLCAEGSGTLDAVEVFSPFLMLQKLVDAINASASRCGFPDVFRRDGANLIIDGGDGNTWEIQEFTQSESCARENLRVVIMALKDRILTVDTSMAIQATQAVKRVSDEELERTGRRLLKAEPALPIRKFAERLGIGKTKAAKLDCWIEHPHKNRGGRRPRAVWEKPAYQDGKREMVLVDATIDNGNTLRELVAEQADDGRHEAVKPNKVLIVRRTKTP